MDSLLANYASSDEEEQQQQHDEEDEDPKPKFSLCSSLPPPKSSLFSSLPPPKSAPQIPPQTLSHLPHPNPNSQIQKQELEKPSPLFSSLPPPKSSHFSLPPPKPDIPNSPQTRTHSSPEDPDSQIQKQELDEPSSLFSSFPPPKSSHFSSFPPPKPDNLNPPQTLTHLSPKNPNSQIQEQKLDKPSSLFSSLPQPKSYYQFSPLAPPKKVVQVKLPAMKPSNFDDDDDDNDDREREGRKTESFTHAPSVKSFLSTIPAPKNSSSTLGALPSALGSGRRSIVEANIPSSNLVTETEVGVHSSEVNYSESSVYDSPSVISEYGVSGGEDDASGWDLSSGNYESYDGNAVYGNYDYYGHNSSNWGEGSADVAQSSVIGVGESVMKVPGKRGRNEIPEEIVEVTQDELTKNRPREDQVKMTGIAFGPAYQPVSTKGKPTKLHKRKHQIGSLYFDMKQKEMELAERRSKGFLTKAETQAKYGW